MSEFHGAPTASQARCDFCLEFLDKPENSFHRIYGGDPHSRLLLETPGFAILPSIGQIVEGYLLLLPRQHFAAIGDLSPSGLRELDGLMRFAGDLLKTEYGPYIVFEHGTRSEGAGGCGIYHAHLHMVPLARTLDPVASLKSTFRCVELAHLSEIRERSAGLVNYLFYQDSDARLYLFDTGPLPSQYMRRLFADGVAGQEWNWRSAGREERLLATIGRLASKFEAGGRVIDKQSHAG